MFGVLIFSKRGLPRGKHAIRIVYSSGKKVNLESFRVYA
jgi:hypothetical protein